MIYILLPIAAAAIAYQILAIAAALRHLFSPGPAPSRHPPAVSILKPVRGLDPHFYEAIRSHAELNYPEYELLFGVGDPCDAAIPVIERLIAEFPDRCIRLLLSSSRAPNGKVGVLQTLAAEARFPVLLMNDGDIQVGRDYLRRVVAPLDDPRNGIVTCLYRASAGSLPGRWESLGIATDFAPSVLVAPLVGVREFGLGSTLVFRAEDLRRAGGFQALADYIADDYLLARNITNLGLRSLISREVVETHLGDDTWRKVWKHQVRWARTIRASRSGGFLGLPLTHAGVWALASAAAGQWWLAIPLLAVRMLSALVTGAGVLRSRVAARFFFLAPLWDLWAFGVWVAGLTGRTVTWRNGELRLTRDGRIVAG